MIGELIEKWEMKRQAMLALTASLTLAIPCHAQNNELDAAVEAYQACLQRAAAQIDDQNSDVTTIATAIVPMCAMEFAAEKSAWGKTFSDPAAAQTEFARMDASQLQHVVEVVLNERHDRAKSN
jgi:hypothetical protein